MFSPFQDILPRIKSTASSLTPNMRLRRWRCSPKLWRTWCLSRSQRQVHCRDEGELDEHLWTAEFWFVSITDQEVLLLFQAEGYTDGDLTLYHSFTVTSFLRAENPIDFLSKASEVRYLHVRDSQFGSDIIRICPSPTRRNYLLDLETTVNMNIPHHLYWWWYGNTLL